MVKETDTLFAKSDFYYSKAEVYEIFSNAEDSSLKIVKFLKPIFKNKSVLDVGVGNGRFAKFLAPVSKNYTGIDISEPQLIRTRKNTSELKNINLVLGSAENLPFDTNTFDIVFGSWVLSTLPNIKNKELVLAEMERVAKIKGVIYLIENLPNGEFFNILMTPERVERIDIYHNWLKSKGFLVATELDIQFEFESLDIAKSIFTDIYGKNIAEKITNKIIKHKIVIFKKSVA